MSKKGKKSGFLWGAFDFNWDGKTSLFEKMIANDLIERSVRENESSYDDFDDRFSSDDCWDDAYELDADADDDFMETLTDLQKAVDALLERAKYIQGENWEDRSDYLVAPRKYKTRAECFEALAAISYIWRESCEDYSDCGVYPDDYETAEEYQAAVERFRWRRRRKAEAEEFDLYITDYEREDEFEAALTEARYGWRDSCEDGSAYDLDPEDFETEEDYEEALEEAKYGWRDLCEDGSDFGLVPESFETETEYTEALEKAKYAWRENCEDGSAYDLDPMDFDSEDDYQDALDEAKVAWRDECEDYSDYGICPYDYETEEEYQADAERFHWRMDRADEADEFDLDIVDYKSEGEFEAALEQEKALRLAESQPVPREKSVWVPKPPEDGTIYTFCGVSYFHSEQVYHYLTEDMSLEIGDLVVVPVGAYGQEVVAEIVTVQKHRRKTAPYPPERAKWVKGRYVPEEEKENIEGSASIR